MPKYCSGCGEKIEGTPKFCPECGNKLSSEEASAKEKPTVKSEGQPYRALPIVYLIVGIISILLPLIVLLVWGSGQ